MLYVIDTNYYKKRLQVHTETQNALSRKTPHLNSERKLQPILVTWKEINKLRFVKKNNSALVFFFKLKFTTLNIS